LDDFCGYFEQLPEERKALHDGSGQAAGLRSGSGQFAVLFLDYIKTMHVSVAAWLSLIKQSLPCMCLDVPMPEYAS
jgi:hypothetical protein